MSAIGAGVGAPTVSVIVATYNAAPFLEACLRSILAQELADLEVVVVDDVSTDHSVAIARAIAAEDSRVRMIAREANGGPAAARNAALALARGRWVAIVDSDDLLHPRRLAALVAAGEGAGADMVADDLLVFQDGAAAPPHRFLAQRDRGAPFRLELDDYLRRSVLYGPEPDPGFLKPVLRRDRLIASGIRYDEALRIAEDADLATRLLLAGFSVLVVPTPWYFYRKHGGSISHRLSLAAVQAMRAADADFAVRAIRERPSLAPRFRVRRRAYGRVVAFEQMVAALKARRPVAAFAHLIRHPSAVPLLRMPLVGLIRKLRRRRAPAAPLSSDEQYRVLLEAANAAGAADRSPR